MRAKNPSLRSFTDPFSLERALPARLPVQERDRAGSRSSSGMGIGVPAPYILRGDGVGEGAGEGTGEALVDPAFEGWLEAPAG